MSSTATDLDDQVSIHSEVLSLDSEYQHNIEEIRGPPDKIDTMMTILGQLLKRSWAYIDPLGSEETQPGSNKENIGEIQVLEYQSYRESQEQRVQEIYESK